ncbi:MAG: response regulator [Chloroflexi bacterium]|nr:response regulator [Chloroflexota bacterium]
MAKARILCVDDDRPTVTIIAAVLKKEGYEVEVAYDGQDGLKRAAEMRPDLIILDIMMPDIDGYEVCRHLKANPATENIGVLMLTAKGDVNKQTDEAWKFAGRVKDRLRGFDSGALEFLTKPVKARDLVQRVKAVLWASGIG